MANEAEEEERRQHKADYDEHGLRSPSGDVADRHLQYDGVAHHEEGSNGGGGEENDREDRGERTDGYAEERLHR